MVPPLGRPDRDLLGPLRARAKQGADAPPGLAAEVAGIGGQSFLGLGIPGAGPAEDLLAQRLLVGGDVEPEQVEPQLQGFHVPDPLEE